MTNYENKNVGTDIDYITSDNILLGKNIQVHYEDFPAPDIGDFADIHAPEQIYLRTNYPKISLEYKNANGEIIDYNDVDINTNLYKPHKDMIVFAMFPIGGLEYNNGISDYVSTPYDELVNYPSISITPTGNFITSAIIPDKLFRNNGLYNNDAQEPLFLENRGIPFEYGERKDTKTAFFNNNSDEREIVVYNWQIDKATSSPNLTLTTNDFGLVSEVCSENFSYINGNAITDIKGVNSLFEGNKTGSSSSSSSGSSIPTRTYILDDYNKEHPELTVNPDYETPTSPNSGLSFLIAIDFLQGTNGECELNFGANIFKIPTNGSAQMHIGEDKKWTHCDLSKDNNNPPKLPNFLNNDGFKHVKTAIFYPVWNGIAVQPGVSLAVPSGSFKQGEPTTYPVGTIAECPLINKERPKRSSYVVPQYEDWVKSGNDGVRPKSGHIKILPNSPVWNGKFSLSFKNTVANFFYMPIFFVPHAKFRMYFSGVKVGEYEPQKDTSVDYAYVYKYIGDSTAIIPGQDGFPEYSYPVEVSGENEDIKKGKLVYINSYQASVIYSYPEEIKDNKNVSFISERVYASMVPPKVPEKSTPKDQEKFWREYNKTLFFVDFEVKNPRFVEEGSSVFTNGMPRKPVEIFGVLLTHIREIKNSPIKNGNGYFTVEPQDSIEGFSANKLFDHKLECDCPNSWIHYATSINVTHNQDGSDGNIVLDKYALMGQDIFPKQHFGGIRLKLEGGNENFITPNANTIYSNINYVSESVRLATRIQNAQYIFSGIATETKHTDSFNSDTIDISLKGLQHKLEDIKLINAPFFDGDDLKLVMRWFSKYAGIEINMDYANQDPDQRRLPTSSNFSKPFFMFPGGTPAIEAIRQACESANHRFILQPDGVGYVYELDKNFSLPLVCKPNYYNANLLTEIPTESILSIDVQPFFGNLYNVVISAALLGSNSSIEAPDSGENVVEIKLNQRISHMQTEPDIPWSRVIAHSWKGYMSEEKLSDRHRIDRSMSKRYMVNGSISIPGNANAWIYDQIKIFGQYFYITDISHSIDLASKTFKTNFNISKYLDEE